MLERRATIAPLGRRARTVFVSLLVALVLLSGAYLYPDPLSITQYPAAEAGPPRVRVGRTVYSGARYAESGVEFFGGLPYAMAPVGARRFAPPEPYVDEAERVVDATKWGKPCMQRPRAERPASSMSEDCLTVNVFRPARADAPLPVMIYLYGSGFQTGTAGQDKYNTTPLVRRSIARGTPLLVLSISYRLGPWAQPGNLALRDQRLALDWAREHLLAFGGDVMRTTLVGQSAGAMSIWHFVRDGDAWWRGVVAHSGAIDTLPLYPPHVRAPTFLRFASAAGCPPQQGTAHMLSCLRAVEDPLVLLGAYRSTMDAAVALAGGERLGGEADLVDVGAYGVFPWAPTREAGDAKDVPWAEKMRGKHVLLGATLDEGVEFVPAGAHSEQDALAILARTLNSSVRAARLWEVYADEPEPAARAARVLGDVWYHAPLRELARAIPGAWYYLYTNGRESGPVKHGLDLDALFSPEESGMGYELADRWISFVALEHPGDAEWKPYPSALELRSTPRAIPLWRTEQIQAAEDALNEMRAEWAS